MNDDKLICVDFFDNEIGLEEKLTVHQKRMLHRAFSLFCFYDDKVLLQIRNKNKYHSGGKIANSCCSHQRSGETTVLACTRRAKEELGIDITDPVEIGSMIYYADFNNGLAEYELDHIVAVKYNGAVKPNPEEIEDVYWESIDTIEKDIRNNPSKYAIWFIPAFRIFLSWYIRNNPETNL